MSQGTDVMSDGSSVVPYVGAGDWKCLFANWDNSYRLF